MVVSDQHIEMEAVIYLTLTDVFEIEIAGRCSRGEM